MEGESKVQTRARLFLALPVPLRIQHLLEKVLTQYAPYLERTIPSSNWHITLMFLGEIENYEEHVSAILQPLSQGATSWNDEQSRRNFEAVSKLVSPGEPLKSRLLLHPLEPSAGGDEFHNGGRQFTSQNDPQFQTIAAWVRGKTAGSR